MEAKSMRHKILLLLFIILISAQPGCSHGEATYTTVPNVDFQRIKEMVEDTFEDVAKISYVKSHLTFYITPKSNFKVDISAAIAGDENALAAWNAFVDEMKQFSRTIEAIHPNFTIVILQPNRINKWLLSVNGEVVLDSINNPSPSTASTSTMPKTTTSEA
jgi:hypothetical protein